MQHLSALPAPIAAHRLPRLIAEHLGSPDPALNDDDPLAPLHTAAQLNNPALLQAVEDELRRAEIEAAHEAAYT
ncbi:hypothetical protein [Allorhizocola rhizosphaerae]|uniref:hypothetical protein n=1 Tax=Allorhizocola rhizosphaerae TaxID=1872709 RepID=UPI000E3E9329|nr:hypothetical protein [Allorhizocola rhizosphaerae]